MADEVVSLNKEQLKILSKVLYHQEVEAAKNIQFHSESEHVRFLHDCKDGYNHALAIIDESAEAKAKYASDEEKAPIANDIFSYSLNLLDFSLQCVRSYGLRLKYLKDIRATTSSMVEALARTTLEQLYMVHLRRMVREVYHINKVMLEHNKRNHNNLSRLFSENVLKETDATFNQIMQKYQRRLDIGSGNRQLHDGVPAAPVEATEEVLQRQVIHPFEIDYANVPDSPLSGPLATFQYDLDEVSQREAWDEIISANGIENTRMTNISRASGAVGGAMLLGMGGMIAWDIHTSKNKLNTVSNDGFNVSAAVGGGMIGSSVSRVAGGAAIFATTAFMAADIITSQNKIETAAKDSVGVVSNIVGAVTYNAIDAGLMAGLAGAIEVTGALAACAIGGVAFAGAVAAGIGISKAGDYFYNLITGKKAEAAEVHISVPPPPRILASDGHKIYHAQMPDGRALARQIAVHT